MKFHHFLPVLLLAGFPCGAATLAEGLKAASDRLAEQPNYSWRATVESAQPPRDGQADGQRQRRQGSRGSFVPPSGKTEKNGFTLLKFQTGSNTTDVVVKGSKVAIQSGDEWQTGEELEDGAEDGGFNRSRFTVRRAQNTKLPAAEAVELAGGLEQLKKEGDVYSGEMTPAAIKQMYTFRGGRRGGDRGSGSSTGGGNSGRRGGFVPDTSKLKGTARFWVKDGMLSKYEYHIEGRMTFGREADRQTEIKRTITVEIIDVGSTKLELPAEARKKLIKA